MISWSESLYWKARGVLLPSLENSQYAYSRRLRFELGRSSRWLDVGCGHDALPDWLISHEPRIDLGGKLAVGIDAERRPALPHNLLTCRVQGNAELLPFRDDTFELVTANMVLEHVRNPLSLFREVGRVLRPQGRFLIHTPNARGYTTRLTRMLPAGLRRHLAWLLHGRRAEDIYPTHYRANAHSDLVRLAAQSGLQVDSIDFVQTSPQLIAVPPLMLAEMLLMRLLAADAFSSFRACIIACFRKPDR
jgi:SAM-dependent methyltransferase